MNETNEQSQNISIAMHEMLDGGASISFSKTKEGYLVRVHPYPEDMAYCMYFFSETLHGALKEACENT